MKIIGSLKDHATVSTLYQEKVSLNPYYLWLKIIGCLDVEFYHALCSWVCVIGMKLLNYFEEQNKTVMLVFSFLIGSVVYSFRCIFCLPDTKVIVQDV